MKATHFNKNNGQGYCTIKVSFRIESHDLIAAACDLISLNISYERTNKEKIKINKKSISDKVRNILFNKGMGINYHLDQYSSYIIEKATEAAKEYFPTFFVDYSE